jgi:hypothetical protein
MSEVLQRHPLCMPSTFAVGTIEACIPTLHSRVYTAQAHPNYEDAPGWFFLFQCFEAVFYLCDRHGFNPEQVVYCGCIGKGIRKHHMWTAMEWKR